MRPLGYVFIGLGLLAGGCLLVAALNVALAVYPVWPRTALGIATAALYGAVLKPLTLLSALLLRPKSLPAAIAATAFTLALCGAEWLAASEWASEAWPVLSLSAAFLPALGMALLQSSAPQQPDLLEAFHADLRALLRYPAEGVTVHGDGQGLTASQSAIAAALRVSIGTVNSRLRALADAGMIQREEDARRTVLRFPKAPSRLRLVR